MNLVVAITGASGSLYAARLLSCLGEAPEIDHVYVVFSSHAREVALCERGSDYVLPAKCSGHDDLSMQVPFVSGSSKVDACVVVPCSMGTLGRIAHGYSDSVITRTADVFLKERRQLILVPRETPWNLIQARNVVTVMEAGALVLPAIPSFYGRPETVDQVVDTVVARILDHLKISHELVQRWRSKDAESRD
ncbi:MAG: UbiX family flavin prenyltransferase [Candidatus Methylacidiphilales bacterium]